MSNWPEISLGDLVEFLGGGTPRRDRPDYWGGDIPWASVKDLQSQSIETTLEGITPEGLANSASNLAPAGSVIIATRVGLGKVAINKRPVAINQDLKALILRTNEMLPRYLLFYLLFKADYFERIGVGTTVKGLTIADYKRLKIALPPLSGQERIVRLLDEADELRKLRARADRRTAELIPALFHDMFSDGVDGKFRWPFKTIGDVSQLVTKGTTPSTLGRAYVEIGIPFLRAENLLNGEVRLGPETLFIDKETDALLTRSQIQPNDVLVSIAGTVGRLAVIAPNAVPMNCNQAVAIIRPSSEINPIYLMGCLGSVSIQSTMFGAAVTGTISNLSLGQIKKVNIPLPPLSRQQDYASQVSKIHKLEADQAASRLRLEALFQSLLHHAFIGAL